MERNKELPNCDLQAAERLGCPYIYICIFGHMQGEHPFEAKGAGGGTISVPHCYIYAKPGCQDLSFACFDCVLPLLIFMISAISMVFWISVIFVISRISVISVSFVISAISVISVVSMNSVISVISVIFVISVISVIVVISVISVIFVISVISVICVISIISVISLISVISEIYLFLGGPIYYIWVSLGSYAAVI